MKAKGADISKRRERLFGTDIKDVKTLLLTPLDRLYTRFKEYFLKEYSGWWKMGYLGDDTIIVKCPSGMHAEDVVYYAPGSTLTLLLGYCGSCDPGIDVGDIVSALSAQRNSGIIRANFLSEKFRGVRLYQVSTIYEQENDKFLSEIERRGAGCIDMESYSVFSLARSRARSFGGLYIVTDNLYNKPFYKVGEEDMKRIGAASDLVVQEVLNMFGGIKNE